MGHVQAGYNRRGQKSDSKSSVLTGPDDGPNQSGDLGKVWPLMISAKRWLPGRARFVRARRDLPGTHGSERRLLESSNQQGGPPREDLPWPSRNAPGQAQKGAKENLVGGRWRW